MFHQREARSLGMSHPGRHVGVRPVREDDKILDFGLVPSCSQNRQGSARQGMETVLKFDGRSMSIM
jgi:hypothetical protein